MSNTQVVLKKKRYFVQRLKSRRFQRRLYAYAATLVIIVLSGLLSRLLTDNNPVEIKVNETAINAVNVEGRILWTYDFEIMQTVSKRYNNRYNVDIYDYDGDGKNEVFFIAFTLLDPNKDIVYYFESDGELQWSYRITETMIYGGKEYLPVYTSNFLLPVMQGNKRTIFCSFSQRPYYPTKIVQFDYTGKLLQYFWNAGRIYNFDYFDIDGDDEKELIVCGTNNDYDNAVLAIFSLDKISGYSPEDDLRYIPEGETSGTFKYYIRIPRITQLLNEIAREEASYIVYESNSPYKVAINTKLGIVFLEMDHNFNVLSLDFSDVFYDQYYDKYKRHFYDDYSYQYLFDYMKKIEFWDGDKWVTEPTINKYWYD